MALLDKFDLRSISGTDEQSVTGKQLSSKIESIQHRLQRGREFTSVDPQIGDS